MTPEQCRDEALNRVLLSDAMFDEYVQEREAAGEAHANGEEGAALSLKYARVSHLRQTAAVYAALAK